MDEIIKETEVAEVAIEQTEVEVAEVAADKKEIGAKIKEMAEMYGQKPEEVKENPQLRKYVEENLKTEKTIHFIVDNAKIK